MPLRRRGRRPCAVLNGRGHAVGKGGSRVRATSRASALMGTVFGDGQRLGFGQAEYRRLRRGRLCRAVWPVAIASFTAALNPAQVAGK